MVDQSTEQVAKFDQGPIYSVHCYLQPFQNLFYLSHVYSGLFLLDDQGIARVTFDLPPASHRAVLKPATLWAEVFNSRTREHRNIVFDMYDASDAFAGDSLEQCDLYFKRSYYSPDVWRLSPKLQAKVMPFGLNFPCQTPRLMRLLAVLLPSWMLKSLRAPVETFRALRSNSITMLLTENPRLSAFEHPPDCPLRRAVHFETRVFSQNDLGADSTDAVNRPRLELARLLKEEFGSSFDGGIVRTPYARQSYPAELSPHSNPRRASYVARSKQILIGVYTRGLHHSVAFKLAEYLAGSKCIVSEPIRNQLPTPLVAGRNYLEFSSPQECVERCRQILDGQELANQMRRDNWEYYQREVRPDRHVANCLERAFAASDR